MQKIISYKRLSQLLFLGIFGSFLLASSDWLMIYGDTTFNGTLSWLTTGVANISAVRNRIAMVLAFIAIVFYIFGMFAIRYFIIDNRQRKNYCALSILSMTPWLCLHFFYIVIFYTFAHLIALNQIDMAYSLCENIFNNFKWVIIASEIFMVLPFIYIFILTIKQKTVLNKLASLNNPLIIFVILKVLLTLMPDCPIRLAILNGLMSEAMLIWFTIYIILGRNKGGFRS